MLKWALSRELGGCRFVVAVRSVVATLLLIEWFVVPLAREELFVICDLFNGRTFDGVGSKVLNQKPYSHSPRTVKYADGRA